MSSKRKSSDDISIISISSDSKPVADYYFTEQQTNDYLTNLSKSNPNYKHYHFTIISTTKDSIK
jgi:hypothetical protein